MVSCVRSLFHLIFIIYYFFNLAQVCEISDIFPDFSLLRIQEIVVEESGNVEKSIQRLLEENIPKISGTTITTPTSTTTVTTSKVKKIENSNELTDALEFVRLEAEEKLSKFWL